MAHFAEIKDGIVQRVVVVQDSEEHRGAEFMAQDLGLAGEWVQCSYSGSIRKNYPGVGFSFDVARDAFIAPQPYPSWILDEETCKWVSPIQQTGLGYVWDEPTHSWIESSGVGV